MAHTDIPPHLMNEHYDDRYFDVINAIDEARQIFFLNNLLPERLSAHAAAGTPFHIGETGFGAGRNVVALLDYLETLEHMPAQIHYHTVELHPMTPEKMAAILAAFRPRLGILVDLLPEAYGRLDTTTSGWHHMALPVRESRLMLHLYVGEALDMLHHLSDACEVWFLDGHGPKKNPAMWRSELLQAIGAHTLPGGSCATFTVAGAVRRELEAAGFTMQKLPGCGGKHHVLQGLKPDAHL